MSVVWYLCPQVVNLLAEYEKDYISILKRDRKIKTDSFQLYDEEDEPIVFGETTIQVKKFGCDKLLKFIETLERWWDPILNYFNRRITSGAVART